MKKQKKDLVEGLKNDDQNTYIFIYSKLYNWVDRYLYFFHENKDNAQTLLWKAIAIAQQRVKKGKIKDTDHLIKSIKTICRNLKVREYKRNKKWGIRVEFDDFITYGLYKPEDDETHDVFQDYDHLTEEEEVKELLNIVITLLNTTDRKNTGIRCAEILPKADNHYADLAEIYNKSVASIKKRISVCRRLFREAFQASKYYNTYKDHVRIQRFYKKYSPS